MENENLEARIAGIISSLKQREEHLLKMMSGNPENYSELSQRATGIRYALEQIKKRLPEDEFPEIYKGV